MRCSLADVFRDKNEFERYLESPSFTMPGTLIDSYTADSKSYLVCKSSLQDHNTVKLVERLELLVLLFIEGGSFIDLADDRWQVYILYSPVFAKFV